MIHEIIKMRELMPGYDTNALLKSYARAKEDSPRRSKRGAVIILHGGGYHMKSVAESEPAALRFLAEGYQAFTLDYSLLPAKHPQQLHELAASVAYIRKNSAKYGIDPDAIALCGFSAGAHLAAVHANVWSEPGYFSELGLEPEDVRPNAVILSYPPTSYEIKGRSPMFEEIVGSNDVEALIEASPVHGVGAKNPPAFIWQTLSDAEVSVRHALIYAEALTDAGIPYELHIFPDGPHAMALCDKETAYSPEHNNPHAASWFPLALEWLEKYGI